MKTTDQQKIGIFGGSFNPVHFGHISVAQYTHKILNLDQLIFIPTYQSPFKPKEAHLVDPLLEHRINMLQLALKEHPHFDLSLWEVEKKVTSYTYHTIQYFRTLYPKAKLYFLLGSDTLTHLFEWKEVETILSQAVVVVYGRGLKRVRPPTLKLIQKFPQSFVFLPKPPHIEISSSEIRSSLLLKKEISSLVPSKIYDYIKDHRLYLS